MTVNEGWVEQNNVDDLEPTRLSEMSTVDVRIIQSAAAPPWRAERVAGSARDPLIIREVAPSGRRTVFQPNSRERLLVFAAEQINGSSPSPAATQ